VTPLALDNEDSGPVRPRTWPRPIADPGRRRTSNRPTAVIVVVIARMGSVTVNLNVNT
jgi:hypothetical protein